MIRRQECGQEAVMERPAGAGYTLAVHVGGGAVHFLPHPAADTHLEWMLRYRPDGLDDKRNSARLAAASVLSGIDYLCSEHISMKEAARRLRLLRAAARAARAATRHVSPNNDPPTR